MEPENRNLLADAPQDDNEATAQVVETAPLDPFSLPRFGPPPGNLRWAFAGSQGLRPGWLALAQLALILLFGWVLTSIARAVHPFKLGDSSLFAVSVEILALYAAIFGSNALTALVRSRGLRWVFIGPQRLRAGWSVALFASIIFLVIRTIRLVVHLIHPGGNQGASGGDDFTAGSALIGEFLFFVLLFFAAWIVSLVERRSVMDYNLSGPRRP